MCAYAADSVCACCGSVAVREPAGVMQAKSLKRQQVMKGIGMKR